jgi:hypothetical protein
VDAGVQAAHDAFSTVAVGGGVRLTLLGFFHCRPELLHRVTGSMPLGAGRGSQVPPPASRAVDKSAVGTKADSNVFVGCRVRPGVVARAPRGWRRDTHSEARK